MCRCYRCAGPLALLRRVATHGDVTFGVAPIAEARNIPSATLVSPESASSSSFGSLSPGGGLDSSDAATALRGVGVGAVQVAVSIPATPAAAAASIPCTPAAAAAPSDPAHAVPPSPAVAAAAAAAAAAVDGAERPVAARPRPGSGSACGSASVGLSLRVGVGAGVGAGVSAEAPVTPARARAGPGQLHNVRHSGAAQQFLRRYLTYQTSAVYVTTAVYVCLFVPLQLASQFVHSTDGARLAVNSHLFIVRHVFWAASALVLAAAEYAYSPNQPDTGRGTGPSTCPCAHACHSLDDDGTDDTERSAALRRARRLRCTSLDMTLGLVRLSAALLLIPVFVVAAIPYADYFRLSLFDEEDDDGVPVGDWIGSVRDSAFFLSAFALGVSWAASTLPDTLQRLGCRLSPLLDLTTRLATFGISFLSFYAVGQAWAFLDAAAPFYAVCWRCLDLVSFIPVSPRRPWYTQFGAVLPVLLRVALVVLVVARTGALLTQYNLWSLANLLIGWYVRGVALSYCAFAVTALHASLVARVAFAAAFVARDDFLAAIVAEHVVFPRFESPAPPEAAVGPLPIPLPIPIDNGVASHAVRDAIPLTSLPAPTVAQAQGGVQRVVVVRTAGEE